MAPSRLCALLGACCLLSGHGITIVQEATGGIEGVIRQAVQLAARDPETTAPSPAAELVGSMYSSHGEKNTLDFIMNGTSCSKGCKMSMAAGAKIPLKIVAVLTEELKEGSMLTLTTKGYLPVQANCTACGEKCRITSNADSFDLPMLPCPVAAGTYEIPLGEIGMPDDTLDLDLQLRNADNSLVLDHHTVLSKRTIPEARALAAVTTSAMDVRATNSLPSRVSLTLNNQSCDEGCSLSLHSTDKILVGMGLSLSEDLQEGSTIDFAVAETDSQPFKATCPACGTEDCKIGLSGVGFVLPILPCPLKAGRYDLPLGDADLPGTGGFKLNITMRRPDGGVVTDFFTSWATH